MNEIINIDHKLLNEISNLIKEAKTSIARSTNSGLTILFWKIGSRINNHVLNNKRAQYGKNVVASISVELVMNFGKSFEEKNLRRMCQFADQFVDFENVVTLSRQLSWSHILILLPIKNNSAKMFYANKIVSDNWSVRELRRQISRKVFERTMIANSQDVAIKGENQVFKDPYLLEFLNLQDGFLELDLEKAILRELELFILELGNGFTFVERQKRMIIDGEDYYLDLLFYHRKLKRLVAIELKIDKFKASYKGQMELYLKWLDKFEREVGEEKPIGLILCAETSSEQIELLEMHKDGIMVAEYWTDLPPKEELERKLHTALQEAKEKIERRKLFKLNK